MISISICLTDLPKEKISVSKSNGKKYINLIVSEMRNKDKYENTHTVFVSQTKEERNANTPVAYVGNGKTFGVKPTTNTTAPIAKSQQNFSNPSDDLPF